MSKHTAQSRFFQPSLALAEWTLAAHNLVSEGTRIHGAMLWLQNTFSHAVDRLELGRARLRGITVETDVVTVVSIRRPIGASKALAPVMQLLLRPDAVQPLLHVLSCQRKEDFDYALNLLHDFLVPAVARPFLQTRNLFEILDGIAHESDVSAVRVRDYVHRGLVDDPEAYKRVDTDRKWTDTDYWTVFDELKASNRWLTSVLVQTRGEARCSGRLHRDCSYACESNLETFDRHVGMHLRSIVLKKRGLFDNRGRAESPTGCVRPVQIRYSHGAFGDKRSNHRLLRVLNSLSDTSLSVYHPNPYVHASILDYMDGSECTIWVASDDTILLVPGNKMTTESLQRICNHVCDEFEEGEILEFE